MVIGIGMPYGNSAYLPFTKQFIIGGSNSLRGFTPRQLGPGKVLTSVDQQVTYPQIGGDYKLELQTEYRFQISGPIHGAVFAEAGNIWTKNELLYGPSGKLSGDFLNSIAVDGGFGIRFDAKVLIIRFDLGVPLRKPWLPLGEEWVIRNVDLKDRQWRRDNLVLNFGIGYPF
jgi:outer membrane protein assembly factor BamA